MRMPVTPSGCRGSAARRIAFVHRQTGQFLIACIGAQGFLRARPIKRNSADGNQVQAILLNRIVKVQVRHADRIVDTSKFPSHHSLRCRKFDRHRSHACGALAATKRLSGTYPRLFSYRDSPNASFKPNQQRVVGQRPDAG